MTIKQSSVIVNLTNIKSTTKRYLKSGKYNEKAKMEWNEMK